MYCNLIVIVADELCIVINIIKVTVPQVFFIPSTFYVCDAYRISGNPKTIKNTKDINIICCEGCGYKFLLRIRYYLKSTSVSKLSTKNITIFLVKISITNRAPSVSMKHLNHSKRTTPSQHSNRSQWRIRSIN